MGTKYTTQSTIGYNASPPTDAGAQAAENLITWSGIKQKLTDPIKTDVDNINTALVAALDFSVRQISASGATVAGDHMRTVEIAPTVTNTITVSLGDASTMTTNYIVAVRNSSLVNQVISRVTGADTIDGTAGNLTILPRSTIYFSANATPNGYLTLSEPKRIVRASQFQGADFGLQLQAAHDYMPSTGGIIDCDDTQGAQSLSASVTITKPVLISLGGMVLTMGANQLLFRSSGSGASGMPRTDENHGTTQFIYSGTGNAVEFKHGTTSTPLFGNVWKNIEVVASGSAVSSGTAVGVAFYGTRYAEINNPEVYNFKQGSGLYFTGNGTGLGFGSTNRITNPFMSTNKWGILVDNAGGTGCTHGHIYDGVIAGGSNAGVAITGIAIASESWRIYGTDTGASSNVGSIGISLTSAADECALFAPRFESGYDGIVIGAGVDNTQIYSPVFITMVNNKITDGGTNTVVIGGPNGPFGSGIYSTGAGIRVSVASVLTHQMTNGTLDVFGTAAKLRLGDAQDVIFARKAANTLAMENGNSDQKFRTYGANGGYWERGSSSELLTIAAAASTDTTGNLLPANSIIEAVVVRVTTAIPGPAATFTVGDATIAARFATGVTINAGDSAIGITHVDQTGTSGPKQVAAAKVRITPNTTPGAGTGVVRIVVFYRTFIAPTS
jgi:hypothetical protein